MKKHLVRVLSVTAALAIISVPLTASALRVEHIYENSVTYGSTGDDNAWASVVDNSGNLYVVGDFEDTVDFDPDGTPDEHTSNGGTDVYITKYEDDGDQAWTKTIGSAADESVSDVAVDSGGNVVIIGQTDGDIDLDPGAGTDNWSDPGDNGSFILKLNSSGNYVWGDAIGGTGDTWAYKLAIDSVDKIHVAGGWTGTTDFDPSGADFSLASVGSYDGFVVVFDGDTGTYDSIKITPGDNYQFIEGIDIDADGNVFLATTFSGETNFGSGVIAGSPDDDDTALTKYDSSMALVWNDIVHSDDEVTVDDMKLDNNGNAYMVGTLTDTTDFKPGAGTANRSSAGDDDAYLAKYDNDGAFKWVRSFGGTLEEDSNAVDIDSQGTVYWGGRFLSDDVDFDTGSGTNVQDNAASRDGFLSIYTSSGAYKGGSFLEGAAGNEEVYSIAADPLNDIVYMTGGAETSLPEIGPVAGGEDAFVVTLDIDYLYNITGLPSNLNAIATDGDDNVEDQDSGGVDAGVHHILISKAGDDAPIAGTMVGFGDDDNDWSNVSGNTSRSKGKSVISGLNQAENAIGSHDLYVPKLAGDDKVVICPDASTLSQVSLTCDNSEVMDEGDSDVSVVTVDGHEYWLVDNLTGTGGISTTQAEIDAAVLAATGDNQNLLASIAAGLTLAGGLIFVHTLRKYPRVRSRSA